MPDLKNVKKGQSQEPTTSKRIVKAVMIRKQAVDHNPSLQHHHHHLYRPTKATIANNG